VDYERKLKHNRVENLPHGRAMVKGEKGEWADPDSGVPIYAFTGYFEPKSRDKVIRIEWDEKWEVK